MGIICGLTGNEPGPSIFRTWELSVDLPGIEPGPRQCECRVIPFYYKPASLFPCRGAENESDPVIWTTIEVTRMTHIPCRGAENRTRTSRTRSVYTTTILRPAFIHPRRAKAGETRLSCRGERAFAAVTAGAKRWTIPDSNRSPHPCHGCALPDELMARQSYL